MPMSLEDFQAQFGSLGRSTGTAPPGREYGWGDRLGASVDSAQAALLGVGEAAGLDWAGARRRNEAEGNYVRAAAIRDTGAPERMSDINGPMSLAKGAAGLAIDSAPQLATSLAAGAFTGGAGLGLGLAGRVGVAALASAPFNTGDILQNQREEAGRTDLPSALALTVPYTAADMVGLDSALATGKLARSGVRYLDDMKGVKGVGLRTAASMARTAPMEGLSEMSQEFINQAGRMVVNPNQTFFNPEANERYMESLAGGALLGGAFGGVAGGWRRSEGFHPGAAGPQASEDLLSQRPDFELQGYSAPQGPFPQQAQDTVEARAANPGQYDLFNPDGSTTYAADRSFSDTNPLQPYTPEWETAPGATPQREPGVPFTRDIPTPGMALSVPIDQPTRDMFGGPPRAPTPPAEPELELTAPGAMADVNQRELDLAPPEPGPQAPVLPVGRQRGTTGQLPFSPNTKSPKGQVLQGFVDSLAEEGHLDESAAAQVSTMIAQGKFALAKKVVDEAVKEKEAADKLLAKVAQLKEKADASAPNASVASRAPADVAPRPDDGGGNNGAVARTDAEPAAATRPVEPGQSGDAADAAGGQSVPALSTNPDPNAAQRTDDQLIEAVETAKDDPEYKAALEELYKRQMDINSEHPEIDTYIEAEYGTAPKQRAFKAEWDAAEARVEEANREGKRGLKVGRSDAGTQSTVSKETADVLAGLAVPKFKANSASAKKAAVSVERATKLVSKILADIPNAPNVEVFATPEAAGVDVPAGIIPEGVTLPDGRIVVFSDAAASDKEVERIVFHELFHRGLRSVMSGSDYVRTMQEISKRSPVVRKLAADWMTGPDGKRVMTELKAKPGGLTKSRMENYQGLATEEGLANLAELLKADRRQGSRPLNGAVRMVGRWLADIAEALGMKSLAQRVRSMSYDEIEKFVVSTVQKSGDDVVHGTEPVFSAKAEATDGKGLTVTPEQAQNFITDFIKDPARKAMVNFAFTTDLARLASKLLPSSQKYVDLMNQRSAVKTRYERKVDKVLQMYDKLPASARGTGPGSVNEFLRESTTSGKWGYAPEFLTGVKADPEMARKFSALPAEAQAVVKEIFKHGSQTLAEMKEAVMGNIASDYDLLIGEAKKANKADEVAELEIKKAGSLRDYSGLMALQDGTPYTPLKRFGNFVVVGRSQQLIDAEKNLDHKLVDKLQRNGDHYFVEFAETAREAKAIARDNSSRYALVQPFEKEAAQETLYGGRDVLGAFHRLRSIATDSDSVTDGNGSKAVNRLINDLHLTLLAEQSARHAERHRRNIAGADKDMMRAFATQGRATAQFIANLHNNGEVYDQLKNMKQEADATTEGRFERREYYNEFLKRHAMSLDYRVSPLVDKAAGVTSMWMLLTNPAYYLQNATQPLMMSLPVVAGKHGYGKSWGAFTKAYGELSTLLRTDGLNEQTYAKLPEDVRAAVEKLVDRGRIDITMDQDLGRWRSTEDSKLKVFGSAVEKLRRVATDVETINRVVTAVAAYRLERAGGASEASAVNYADKMIYDTHGDYSGFNAPRITRTPLGRLATQFRKFQAIQISLTVKLIKQAFDGVSPEERAAGRAALAFTLGHVLAMGGVMALPGFASVAWIIGKAFGDDDEPVNPELSLRRAIGDESMSDLLLKGVPKLSGVDLSGKLGMGQMLSVLPYTDVDFSRDGYARMITALMGPFIGGLGTKAADGIGRIAEGEYYRGLETMMPTGLSNIMKGTRLAGVGDAQRNGDVTLNAEEISVLDGALTALGLPTNTVTDKQFLQGAKYDHDKFFRERAHRIMKEYSTAYKSGDGETLSDARDAWIKLQDARARNGYTKQPLANLLKAPMDQRKREKNTAGGVEFKKDNRGFVEEVSEL